MIFTQEFRNNFETYPDEALKEAIGMDGICEAIENLVSDKESQGLDKFDDIVWYPFMEIYRYPPIKGKIPMPTGKLEERINIWEQNLA